MGRRNAGAAGRIIVIGLVGLSFGAPRADESCGVAGASAEVAVVLDDLELALEDGRVLRLAGLDPVRATAERPSLAADARTALQRLIGAGHLRVEPLTGAPDRWDRTPALVGVADAGPADAAAAANVNAALIERGWARARPEPLPRHCSEQFRGAEARARAGGVGLWADPYYAVVSASDAAGLARRTGAMAVVDGVVSVRHERYRTILAFGSGGGLIAVVSRQNEKRLAKAGLDLQKLVGQEVRIRGFLDDRFGPRIDLVDAGQVEVVALPDRGRSTVPNAGMGSPDRSP